MRLEFVKGNLNELKQNTVLLSFDENLDFIEFDEIKNVYNDFDNKYNKIEGFKIFQEEKVKNLILVGLGKSTELDEEKVRVVGGNLIRKIKSLKQKDIHIVANNLKKEFISAFIEGINLGNYEFDKYKTKTKEEINIELKIYHDENIENEMKNANNLSNAIIIARDLTNEPSNVIYPKTLAEEVKNLGNEYGFEVEIFDEEKIKELKMDAFLSVAKGSKNKPRFIVMRYLNNKSDKEILGLVGKGLTYDSGGYSIKSTTGMFDMKTDMSGAADVIGVMCAISKAKINKNVVAVVAACENAISSKSYKPGDIINSMGKKTIEIVNTDAEGRLTLADAMYYIINNEKATKVVDIATLTGAAVTVLGSCASVVISNNDKFYNEFSECTKLAGEKVWRLPIFEEYKKQLKGEEADLKNSGGREAGSITAGMFIGEFVGDVPWIHIDIAGTATVNKASGYKSKGATGEGIRSLYYLAKK